MRRPRHLPAERRAVVGTPPARPGALAILAFEAKCYAHRLGLEADLFYSRVRCSSSRYLRIPIAGRRRPVEIRISDHPIRKGTFADFEVISLDGQSGLPEAQAFLEQVVRGEVL